MSDKGKVDQRNVATAKVSRSSRWDAWNVIKVGLIAGFIGSFMTGLFVIIALRKVKRPKFVKVKQTERMIASNKSLAKKVSALTKTLAQAKVRQCPQAQPCKKVPPRELTILHKEIKKCRRKKINPSNLFVVNCLRQRAKVIAWNEKKPAEARDLLKASGEQFFTKDRLYKQAWKDEQGWYGKLIKTYSHMAEVKKKDSKPKPKPVTMAKSKK